MRRFTIGSADRMHLALKEAAARQNRSMDPIVEESLELRGIRLCGTTKDYELRWVSRLRFDLLDEVFHGGFVTGVPGITS